MATFEQLDALLSMDEERYYADDVFLEAEELVQRLSAQDLPVLLEALKTRGPSWRERFAHDSTFIKQDVLAPLLESLLTLPLEPEPILSLMTRLPKTADQSPLCQSLVVFAAKAWDEFLDLRVQVQMCTWSCGLSRRLLSTLGFKSWKEAGL